jgi:hypothetical protein
VSTYLPALFLQLALSIEVPVISILLHHSEKYTSSSVDSCLSIGAANTLLENQEKKELAGGKLHLVEDMERCRERENTVPIFYGIKTTRESGLSYTALEYS